MAIGKMMTKDKKAQARKDKNKKKGEKGEKKKNASKRKSSISPLGEYSD